MSRRSTVATIVLVLVGVAGGVAALGRSALAGVPPRSADRAQNATTGVCDSTRIKGTTVNETGIPMQVLYDGHNSTNEWCRVPQDEVRAHSSNTWHIADSSPPVTMWIVYRLENGDEVRFQSQLRKPEGTETGCSIVKVVRTVHQFECRAEVGIAGPDFAYVKFIVLPRPVAGANSR
ncbi:MAG TPA: hypothetical protein VFB39_14625 [Solirubrobacteraceae bacterium]|nr:hypothetical protein [Solirubrobacteraceae bacterium]